MIDTLKEAVLFSKDIAGFGLLEFRAFDLENNVKTLHSWVTMPYATYWGMLDNSVEQVYQAYKEVHEAQFHEAIMGYYNGEPAFLIEKYKASEDAIGKYYNVKSSDYGMHILVGPVTKPIKNFTWHIFSSILEFFFTDSNIERIVVEPDVRNDKIHVLNKKGGFKYAKEVQLPHKKAALAFCNRNDFKQALEEVNGSTEITVVDTNSAHLKTELWERANKHLVAKAISEFSHELLFEPKFEYSKKEVNFYSVTNNVQNGTYFFSAVKQSLDHWYIDADSIYKKDATKKVNAFEFIIEFQEILKIPANLLPTYLEEISSTLSGLAYKFKNQKYSSNELVTEGFQAIEHAMIEGHPCFVANNGRLGFNTDDYEKYAPETDNPFQIIWLAGHKSKAVFTAVEMLNYEKVMQQELGLKAIVHFNKALEKLNKAVEDYIFIPVHPWQWKNKLVNVFANDIANQDLIYLGKGDDMFSAQQSIRTLYNVTDPNKFYTKTALSILNMGFMRGLSPYYMQSTPPITEWISNLLENDTYLKSKGFTMLGEVATVGYRNDLYEPLGKSLAHNKMLSALWRESPHSKIEPQEKLMTMAAFLHRDADGTSFLLELIKASPYNAQQWIKKYLEAYLSPLLHCFFTYEMVFMPHGENLIMVMNDNTPVRVLMKDITEEVIVFNENMKLPEHVDRLFTKTSDTMKVLSIFTDVFDCFFRFMSSILDKDGVLPENEFWKLVADCILEYQNENPQLANKFTQYDLFISEFDRCCLNRLQLKNNKQMLDLGDPIESLSLVGVLENPIAKFN